MSISIQQAARAVTALGKMSQEKKVALCDEIFERQPDLFFLILGLSQEGMSDLGAEYALQKLLVIYSAMKEAGRNKRVTRAHLDKGVGFDGVSSRRIQFAGRRAGGSFASGG